MAALNRCTEATYEIHEAVKVDTSDNEDHTFCGIMFPVKAKALLPVEKILIHSVAVRGQLGPLTVWVSNDCIQPDPNGSYRIRLNPRHWTKIYEQVHPASQRQFRTLDFSDKPILLRPNQVRAIYIHSTLPGDEAIVYDNSYPQTTVMMQNLNNRRQGGGPGRNRNAIPPTPRHDDQFLTIGTGKAHLSPVPFGQVPIWGWGNAWRDHREFVGQVNYGVIYKLWSPANHCCRTAGGPFSEARHFHAAVLALLACQRRPRSESPVALLPDECLYYILHMCRWDWFGDTYPEVKLVHHYCKGQRKLRERQERERLEQERQRRAAEQEELERQRRQQRQQQRLQQTAAAASSVATTPSCSNSKRNGAGGPAYTGRSKHDDDDEMFYDAKEELKENNDSDDEDDEEEWQAADVEDNQSSAEGEEDMEEVEAADDENNDDDEVLPDQDESPNIANQNNNNNQDDNNSDSDESEWERANGYRADNTVFTYRDFSSDAEDDEDEDGFSDEDDDAAQAAAQAALERRAWYRRHFARIHILQALAQEEQQHQQHQRYDNGTSMNY